VALIHSTADPLFGVATGAAAYYLWERDPRNAHSHGPGSTLADLVARRFGAAAPAAPLPGGDKAPCCETPPEPLPNVSPSTHVGLLHQPPAPPPARRVI